MAQGGWLIRGRVKRKGRKKRKGRRKVKEKGNGMHGRSIRDRVKRNVFGQGEKKGKTGEE